MKRTPRGLLFSWLIGLLAFGFATPLDAPMYAKPLAAAPVAVKVIEVEITDQGLKPRSANIESGGTVIWKNSTKRPQLLLSEVGLFEFPIQASDRFTQTFAADGTYFYYLAMDPTAQGAVVVGSGRPNFGMGSTPLAYPPIFTPPAAPVDGYGYGYGYGGYGYSGYGYGGSGCGGCGGYSYALPYGCGGCGGGYGGPGGYGGYGGPGGYGGWGYGGPGSYGGYGGPGGYGGYGGWGYGGPGGYGGGYPYPYVGGYQPFYTPGFYPYFDYPGYGYPQFDSHNRPGRGR